MKSGKQAVMKAQFWKALRKALYEDKAPAEKAPLARMEWKAAA